MQRIISAFAGNRLTARLLRSASWVLVGYAGAQGIRLASNLILTRILFPEAFGLMALVTVITVGLMMFSDVGVGPSIAQSKRGDDPDFLNTAWTIQIIRGGLLWAITLVIAGPVARFYDQPDLVLYLPVAGFALVITGFLPTRIETAHRHLVFGRLTRLDLVAQFIGVGCMVVLALITGSVMALVAGAVLTALARLILTWRFLPGEGNRLRLEPEAVHEQIHFGKWIFLSTAFAFVSTQGDKAILGKLVPLETLGIYNIGYFLASFPVLLGVTMAQNLLIPVYRDRPPEQNAQHRARLRKMRLLVTGSLFGLLSLLSLLGPWIIALLYDPRYASAGAMMVVMALGFLPQAIGVTYDRAALAAGDSRGAFVYSGIRALLQVGLLVLGFQLAGLLGGLASYGIAMLLSHPVLIRLARRHHAWDGPHDIAFLGAGLGVTVLALWLHWEAVIGLGL